MKLAIVCDFDGTITQRDTGKELLSKLTAKDWESYDQFVISGEMGTREALQHQWGMIENTSAKEVFSIVDEIEIDPFFKELYELIQQKNWGFVIVSDGFLSYIKRILNRNGIMDENISIKANDFEIVKGKILLKFLTESCEHGCANCKFTHVTELREQGFTIIYIGDGLSDILPAKSLADYIFAKKDEDLAKNLKGDKRLKTFKTLKEVKNDLLTF